MYSFSLRLHRRTSKKWACDRPRSAFKCTNIILYKQIADVKISNNFESPRQPKIAQRTHAPLYPAPFCADPRQVHTAPEPLRVPFRSYQKVFFKTEKDKPTLSRIVL